MELRTYLNGLSFDAQADFASRCGTTVGYLRKAISVGQQLGPVLCVAIERESARSVTRQDLRDDWRDCWPELADLPQPDRRTTPPRRQAVGRRSTDHSGSA